MSDNKPPRELNEPPMVVAFGGAVKKNKGGRPKGSGLKFAPELQERFCKAVAGAMPLTSAARLCGISLDTFQRWIAKGRKGIEPYKAFVEAYEKAEVELQQYLLLTIKIASPSDWRAAVQILKMRFPKLYSDYAQRLEVLGPEDNGAFGFAFQINVHLGDDAEWQRRWNAEVEQRRRALEPIPAVSDDDARAIEFAQPGTKV